MEEGEDSTAAAVDFMAGAAVFVVAEVVDSAAAGDFAEAQAGDAGLAAAEDLAAEAGSAEDRADADLAGDGHLAAAEDLVAVRNAVDLRRVDSAGQIADLGADARAWDGVLEARGGLLAHPERLRMGDGMGSEIAAA